MHRRKREKPVFGEFHLRGQNSRMPPLHLRWTASESLYYGGGIEVVGGPVGLRSRFENRLNDRSWLKNDPDRVAGGRPFEESFFATVAFLLAFADAERLMIECTHSPVPMTSTSVRHVVQADYSDLDDGERGEALQDGEPPHNKSISGTLRAG